MESSCLRHSELPHTTKLFLDYVYDFSRVKAFYSYDPRDAKSYAAAAREIRFPAGRRQELVEALRRQNGDSPALETLARPEAVAVVTGQQVGLLSGPAYTAYKAITAVRLARKLTAEGIVAVPVFWLATEDHDLAEVNHCWTFDAARQPIRIELDGTAQADQPVGSIPIEHDPAEALRRAISGLPFAEEVLEVVGDSYAPGRTFGSAFAELLKRLFGNGLLLVDPLHPASRRLAAPLLREAVRHVTALTARLLERNRELEAAGYHAQVHVEEQSSLLFMLEGGRRVALHRSADGFVAGARKYAAEELEERAEQLSPNALLRPVVQDSMLPTAAYVGGPAELAYLAQSEVIYRALLGRMPVAVSRASFTLLDTKAGRLMDRYGLRLPELFHSESAVRERIAQKLVDPALSGKLEETRSRTAELLEALRSNLAAFDPTLAEAFDKSRRKVLYQLDKTQRKTARESLRRNERALRDASYLMGLVYPHQHPQERFYSILPLLAAFGPDLIERLVAETAPACPDHRVLAL